MSQKVAPKLTPKKFAAVVALLSTSNQQEAAAAAGVARCTLVRWMKDETFRVAMVEAEAGAIDQATRRLIGLSDNAINTISVVLTDPNTTPGIRLRAAQTVLEFLLKLRELRNVEQRLVDLESRIFGNDQ